MARMTGHASRYERRAPNRPQGQPVYVDMLASHGYPSRRSAQKCVGEGDRDV